MKGPDFKEKIMSEKKANNSKKSSLKWIIPVSVLAFFLAAAGILTGRALSYSKIEEVRALTEEENLELNQIRENYKTSLPVISELPYSLEKKNLDLYCKSAILIDGQTGSILYEKNADEEIPPASMTKLVEMYVVYEAIAAGSVKLTDIVPLPPECWAENLPWDASRMGLGEDQIVTLDELLLGLAIPSANDASIAVANYVAGDMDSFVARMNKVVKDLGLEHTHFVESSGYSENNVTTPREFVKFCKIYLEKYPWALEKYHSKAFLRYPREENLPEYERYMADAMAYTQYNTNKLIGKLAGVDGLKTGYIDESGYNLALTAKRNESRFISITMGGPGQGSAEGNRYRNADGSSLMNYAFTNFADYKAPDLKSRKGHRYLVPVLGAKEKAVYLIPAADETFTVPFITGSSVEDSVSSVKVSIEIPSYLKANAQAGKEYGKIKYYIGDNLLYSLPLIADRKAGSASTFAKFRAELFALVLNIFNNTKK